ncbi:MAG: VIT1/CCC1 transporter family protein [Patescibacteria group bacterium]
MSIDLEKHLLEEHDRSPFSTYLKEIIYGGNDGIVTTFAVVAGFTGAAAQVSNLPLATVLLFGFANLAADGVSMSLGNFLSTNSEKDIYRTIKEKERGEIKKNPHFETEESIQILIKKGFSPNQAKNLVEIYKTNESYWLDFMMEKELQIPNPENEHPLYMAFATLLSFVGFGLIPLLPYVFFPGSPNLFTYSVGATLLALILLGLLRWKVTRQHWLRTITETLALGSIAALVAYVVGTMFRV